MGQVYGRALVQPLAACMLPVMIATLVAALEGLSLLPFFFWGFPGALVLASAWTAFRLRATPAEVHVDENGGAVRMVWEVLDGRTALPWQGVHDLRLYKRTLIVTVGYQTYELDAADWPDFDALFDALREARHAGLLSPA